MVFILSEDPVQFRVVDLRKCLLGQLKKVVKKFKKANWINGLFFTNANSFGGDVLKRLCNLSILILQPTILFL